MRLATLLGVVLLAAGSQVLAPGAPAMAQDADGRLGIELNKLEPQDSACRTYFVLQNGTDIGFTELVLDIYIFNGDGIIERRLAMDTRAVMPGKTQVRLFDVRDLTCDAIGRFLINGVLSCSDTEGERSDCAGLLAFSTRTGVELAD